MIMHKLYLKIFLCQPLGDYHDLYMKTDVLLQAVFENFPESFLIIVNSTLHILHEYDFELDRLTV